MPSCFKFLVSIALLLTISSCTKITNKEETGDEEDNDPPVEKTEKFIIEKPFDDMMLIQHQHVVAEQSDGKIILILQDGQLKRITNDGAADNLFVPPTMNSGSLVFDMTVQKDDKIVIVEKSIWNLTDTLTL